VTQAASSAAAASLVLVDEVFIALPSFGALRAGRVTE
jgi:hypothetical protein